MGHNFALHLQDHRFLVERVNVGLPCESKGGSREDDPAQRFVNQKAYFYHTLANAFEQDRIEGLTDEMTIGQLAGVVYEIESHGRMRIESKEEARKRGVVSPDRAEALMLALCKPPQKYEWHSIRELGRLRPATADGSLGESSAHPYWGFWEKPYDPAEEMALPRRWPRGRGF
jgi:hypothetical protein